MQHKVLQVVVAVLLLVPAMTAAAPTNPNLHGIVLGMTLGQAAAAARLPCRVPRYTSDLFCKDADDGSEYLTMFSAGTPSIALTVQHDFCSGEAGDAFLRDALEILNVPASRAHRDPDGYYIDLDSDNEAVLNTHGKPCSSGGKRYVLLIRSDRLIEMSSRKAAQRARKARH